MDSALHVDNLSLNRQVTRMARRGLEITTQVLCDQLERLYILLVPTLIVLHERILQAVLVQADETTWRVMGTGGSKKWWVWTISDGEAVYFQIVPSRGKAAGRQLFRDYAGTVMADDYAVYTALEKERTRQGGRVQVIDGSTIITLPTPDYVLASCWAHARRYFVKAARYHDEAEQALDLIDALFHIEQEAQEQARAKVALARKAGDADAEQAYTDHLMEARRRLRNERSREVVAELDAWRKEQRPMPGSAMDEALNHLDKIWPRLILFLDDPRIPLDNNLSERQVRGPVLGRKNFQGSRSETGTRVAALFYSLLATCRLMGIDPHAYLLEAVRRAVKDRKSVFLPHDFRDMLHEQKLAEPAEEG
ncbi:IS66 family transposase [bacterium]|nr:IS66 family transposase [bacterium]